MKQIYRIHVDAWDSYTGYFSSMEEAFRILPSCPRFRRALSYRRPTGCEILPETFTFASPTPFYGEINIQGLAEITIRTYEETPEVRVPGVPYQPAKRTLVGTTTVEKDTNFGLLEVDIVLLDATQEA